MTLPPSSGPSADATLASAPASSPLGLFEGHTDIGPVKHPGSLTYDAAQQEYRIAGAGTNMWLAHDEFHFAWRRMRGDFILTARCRFLGKGVDLHRKLGWIVRSALTPDAAYAD